MQFTGSCATDTAQIRISLDKHLVLLECFVGVLMTHPHRLLLSPAFALLAHQDLLKLLRQDVQVAGQQGEEVRVIEENVRVELVLLVAARHIDVHRKGHVLSQDRNRLGFIKQKLLFSFGDSLSL